jgi:hypothetical protein
VRQTRPFARVIVVQVQRFIRPFAIFFGHIEVGQITRRFVVVVAEFRVVVGMNSRNAGFLDSACAVFLPKRRDDQEQRFLGIVFAGYLEHAGIDQRLQFGGQSESWQACSCP